MERERVIGIDIGTTNACAAVVESGVPMVIPTLQGQSLLPTVIGALEGGKRVIGQMAKRQAVVNAEHTASGLKRLIGRKFASQATRQTMDSSSFRITAGANDEVRVVLRGESYAVVDLYAQLIHELKRAAEQYLHETVRKAVLTVPAGFTDAQRQAVKDAGQRAGLEILRVLNEPSAAGIAYGIGQGESKAQRVAIYSLGGGAFDFSVLGLRGGVYEVQSTAGDPFLGGEDFDRRVLDWLIFGFAKDNKIDLRQDRTALQRLRDAVEKAKCELSSMDEVVVEIPFVISTGTSEPLHLTRTLSRAKLDELTEDLIERTLDICRAALAEAGLDPHEIDSVVLVGGMTRMPRVQAAVQSLFGRSPSFGLPPEEVIALGAALQGAAIGSERPPSQPVAARGLGILVAGGRCFRLIEPGSELPCERRHIFTTTRDQQTGLKIFILEGEGDRGEDNDLIGEFVFDGLPPAARGEAEVEVCFQLDVSGALSVSARDLESGEQRIMKLSATESGDAPALQLSGPAAPSYALDTHDEMQRSQQRIERLISEIQGLLPRAEIAVGASDLGLDAIRRARAAIERAKIAIIRGDPNGITDTHVILKRTATMLRGVTASLRIG